MSDEILVHGKNYVSSKRAAEETGYARDYIGQLCRGGLIAAERVGGLWYVSLESLREYEKNAEAAKAAAVAQLTTKEHESSLHFEGREYISASRASKISGYNQDYVGQLARGGKIPSHQVGNRWYVDRDALLKHKAEKDALLAAVQAESVGINRLQPAIRPERNEPRLVYIHEERDLLPKIGEKKVEITQTSALNAPIRHETVPLREKMLDNAQNQSTPLILAPIAPAARIPELKTARRSRKPVAALAGTALTIILMLSIGIATMSNNVIIASSVPSRDQLASAGLETVGKIGDFIENTINPELTYIRE